MMNKNILMVAVYTFIFFSCTNENDIIESSKTSNNETYLPQVFAKQLALSLKNNGNLRDFLKEEANKQKDGDYDILIAEIIDHEIKTESMLRSTNTSDITPTFRESINQNEEITSVLTEIENNYPLLQVAIPNMENASWETIISGKDPFYVAFLPFNYEEGDDVLAYDQNGNEHILDGKNEPETPVIVIGVNERITCVTTSVDRNEYEGMKVYFDDEYRTYYSLEYENNEVKTTNTSFSFPFGPTIWKAAFASQDAMRQYEPWTKGRPEVAVSVANSTNNFVDNEFDNTGWWDANENILNYTPGLPFVEYSSTGNETNYYPIYYGWWELDFVFSLQNKTQSVPVYNKNGIKFNVSIPIGWLGDSNDFIGYNCADFYTYQGKKHETIEGKHGSGDLYFWLRN